MAASFEGHVDIVRMLIKAKAKVNLQDEVCNHYCTHAMFGCTAASVSINFT